MVFEMIHRQNSRQKKKFLNMLLGRISNHNSPKVAPTFKKQQLGNRWRHSSQETSIWRGGRPTTPTAGTWSFIQLCLSLLSSPCFILEKAVSFKSKWLHTKLNMQSVRFAKRLCVYQNKCPYSSLGEIKQNWDGGGIWFSHHLNLFHLFLLA